MTEARAISEALCIHIGTDYRERRPAGAGAIRDHKTSMLQDLESGKQRSMRSSSLVQIARLVGGGDPIIDVVSCLVRELACNRHGVPA